MESGMEDSEGILAYKAAVQGRYSMVEAYGACAGHGQRCLDELYVDLLIVQQWPESEAELECHLRKKGNQEHLQELARQGRCLTIQRLFEVDQDGKVPKTVVLEGVPGIGKTFTSQRVIMEWASNQIYSQLFSVVFYVGCSAVTTSQHTLSLTDVLVSDFPESLQTLKETIVAQPEKVLIILDGLADVDVSDEQTCQGVSVDSKLPPLALLGQLLARRVLPEASLLITTRPGVLSRTKSTDRHTTILGFSEEGQRQYFSKFFGSECLAAMALDCLRCDKDLITMCFIPLACLLVCRSLELRNGSVQRLETTTRLLTSLYLCLLGNNPLDSDQAQNLVALALHGVNQKKVIFDELDLKTHEVHPTAATRCFLNKTQFNSVQSRPRYSFAHLAFQEVFAAACCVGATSTEDTVKLLEDFLSSKIRQGDLNSMAFDLFLHHIPIEPLWREIPDETHLVSTLRFLFGLMNEESAGRLGLTPRPELREKMLDWSRRALEKIICEEVTLLLYGCLNEIHEDTFVKSALEKKKWFYVSSHPTKPVDYTAVTYCLPLCKEMNSICIARCSLGIQGLKAFLSGLQKCSSMKLEELALHEDTFGNEGIKLITPVLNTLDFTKLSLWSNKLTDECMADLSPVLQQNQRLKILDLQCNQFQAGCVPGLLGILEKCLGLERLILASNQLGDAGVKLLSDWLKVHGSKQQALCLMLNGNGLTDACAGDLSSALKANPLLTVDLARNAFTDQSIPSFLPVIQNIWSYFWETNQFTPDGMQRLESESRKKRDQARAKEKHNPLVTFIKKWKGPPH